MRIPGAFGETKLVCFSPVTKLTSRNGRFIFCRGAILMGKFSCAEKIVNVCVREREIEVSLDMMQLPCNVYRAWIKFITHK